MNKRGISTLSSEYIIYGGVGGIILKDDILNLGKKILHIHPGRVPEFRGSTTAYYSILKENNISASAIFFDRTIDTGPLICTDEFPIPEERQMIDLIYDPMIRAKLLLKVVRNLATENQILYKTQKQNANAETYFIIHPVLKHIAILGNHGKL